MHTQDASNLISESEYEYGSHTLLVYEDLTKLRESYPKYITKRIKERNEVILLAPFYETEDTVRKYLSKSQNSLNTDKGERNEKSLMIVDSLKKYLGNDSLESDYDSNKNLVDYAKTNGKSGVPFIGDIGAFPYSCCLQDLLSYELSIPSAHDIDIKRVCLYHHKDFDLLSIDDKSKLMNHHKTSIKI
jgi:hypothetical protein